MHVFLTGAIRTGKSTIIERFISLGGFAAGGFRTSWQPDGTGGENLLLLPFASGQTDGTDNRAAHRTQKDLTVYPEIFDRLGPLLLADNEKYPLTVMDELGFMESRSPLFQAAVMRCLDSPAHVLGVIRARPTPFLDQIRNRPGTVLLTVGPDNHEKVLKRLTELFKEIVI